MIIYLIASSCLFILHTIQISMQQKEIRELQEKVRELKIPNEVEVKCNGTI